MIDATGELLEAAGPQFTLPELARQAGVGTATVYRHFETINDAMIAFENRTIEGLIEQISQTRRHSHGLDCFRQVCLLWTTRAATVSAAARYIRSPAGFLERLAQQDRQISELRDHLGLILTDLAEDGSLPALDRTAMNTATLLWVTLFDERMVVDLTRTQGWTASRTADFLGAAVLAGLKSTA